jgi:hypothetical protein
MKARILTFTSLAVAVVLVVAITVGQDSAPRLRHVSGPSPIPAAFTEAAPADVAISARPRAEKDSLIGSWTYSAGLFNVQLDIAPDTLNGTFSMPIEDTQIDVIFHGEYSVTTEKLLYGVIQSADIRVEGVSNEEQLLESKAIASRLIEQPFALRVYVHDSVLMVKDVNLGIPFAFSDDDEYVELRTMLVGRYTRSEG